MKQSQLKVSFYRKVLSEPINCSGDIYRYLMSVWDRKLINLQEQVYVLYLNNINEVISWRCLSTGTGDESLIDIRLTLSMALSCMAHKMIIAHNHPAGDLSPSSPDIAITDKLAKATALLDISLLDHVIVCQSGYYSLLDHHMMAVFY